MADYILGAVLVLLFILAARSYFGKKFGSSALFKQGGLEGAYSTWCLGRNQFRCGGP